MAVYKLGGSMALIYITLTVFLQGQLVYASRSDSLRMFLTHFNSTRSNDVNPTAKAAARDYIVKTFRDLGLDTWTQEFPYRHNFPVINVIGRVRGKYTGTSRDKVLVIGAHYDTTDTTPGVDDNGSGVTVLLQTAKEYMTQDSSCAQKYTLMFVAFDLEEVQKNCANCPCSAQCGSQYFVQNLTRYLNETRGQFRGAYILDTVMNYNNTANSQILPTPLAAFPNINKTFSDNKFRGDFLALIGRHKDDDELSSTFISNYSSGITYNYSSTGDYKAYQIQLSFSGRPANLQANIKTSMKDFLRSDHAQFWDKSLPAVFLTDTAQYRDYMRSCYHQPCDDMSHVTPQMIGFMGKTAETLVKVVTSMSHRMCSAYKCHDYYAHSQSDGQIIVQTERHDTIYNFHTANYPSPYPNRENCTWWRSSEKVQIIQFYDFELESSTNCQNDYVEIRAGRDTSAPLIGRYCGSNKPPKIALKPPSKVISVRFHTDAFDTFKGFKASWSKGLALVPPLPTGVLFMAMTSLLTGLRFQL